MKFGRTLQEFAEEINRQQQTKKDYIASTEAIDFVTGDDGLKMELRNGDVGRFAIRQNTHRQLGSYLKIPANYYDRLQQEAAELLTRNVNHWLHEKPVRRMVRILDGSARAFLSDSYRRIDHYDILNGDRINSVLPVLANNVPDLKIESCEVTEDRMYVKALFPRIQREVKVGDPVQAGVVISNSEIGKGSVRVEPLIYRLVCTNGMIAPAFGQRRYHIGRQADGEGAAWEMFRDDTKAVDDRAFMMKVRDTILNCLDETRFDRIVQSLTEATERKIAGNPEKSVDVLSNRFNFSEEEKGGILRHLIEGGDLSAWGVASAVTRTGEDLKSYDRATEFETLGWNVIELQPDEWREVAEAGIR